MTFPHSHWYHATSVDSEIWSGRCATREEAVAEGLHEYDGEVFFVVEASSPPVSLADWIGIDDILERADEAILDSDRACSEYDEDGIFTVTPAQEADLVARLRAACEAWQEAHGLTFTVNTFASMSDPEQIGDYPEPEEPMM